MFERWLAPRVREALADTPVVFLQGPRQAGKSTLARALEGPRRYMTLDDAALLAAATADPGGFLAGIREPVVLDEVQLAPGLFRALKATVDRDRRPGRFLLTGSADSLLLPGLAEALTGRMEVLTLWPLAQAEMEGRPPGFLDAAFGRGPLGGGARGRPADLLGRTVRGGFPEAAARKSPERRAAWFGSYLSLLLQRDVRAMADVAGLSDMPRLLALLAHRSPGLINAAEMSRTLAMPQTTLRRYVALLEAAMLIRFLPAWSGGGGRRLVKSPRLLLSDAGLACHLLGTDEGRIAADPTLLGNVLQVFVSLEVMRAAAASREPRRLFHYRGYAGREVDLVVEDRRGRVVGIEVKAAATVGPADFSGLRALAEDAGERFHRGVLLHGGREPVSFGRGLEAVPFDALWG